MSQINITLSEFINMYSDIIGYTGESQCAIDIVNKARIIAYASGDWVGTVSYQRVILNGCSFILPSKYESVKRARLANGYDIYVDGMMDSVSFDECCESVVVKTLNKSYIPIQLTENSPLYFTAVNKKDLDKEIRVSYIDTAGSMHDEIIKLLHRDLTRLVNIPSSILRVEKPLTVGMVMVKQGLSTGYIDAFEKSPTYSVYSSSLSDCAIAAEVKHKFIPYTLDDSNTVLDINPEALSSLVLAVKVRDSRENGWQNSFAASVKFAIDFLKMELKNETVTAFGFLPVNYDDQLFNSLTQP